MILDPDWEVIVVGGGPAGLCAAIGLANSGLQTALATAPAAHDNRTAALLSGSVAILQKMGAWSLIAPHSAPLVAIRIIDDTGGLLRAPEVLFTAAEAGLECFGFNIPNFKIVAGLRELAAALPNLRVFETSGVCEVTPGAAQVSVRLQEGGQLHGRFVVAADGRNSICRKAAEIDVQSWSYDQSALTCGFAHSRPHGGISTEFHRRAGPLTVVPSPGLTSSLVWVERPSEATRLAGLDEIAFRAALEERLQGLLGGIGAIGRRGVFPITGLSAKSFGRNRILLVGEAGHVLPPIGAQGLNLGIADAAAAVEILAGGVFSTGSSPDDAAIVAAYDAARRRAVAARVAGVDLLNRSLLTDVLPLRLARGLGLIALGSIPPLKRWAMRAGLGLSLGGAEP